MSGTGLGIQGKPMIFSCRCREDTYGLGRAFGITAPRRGIIALRGTLGAGKTLFVQGLAQGLGIASASVTSPSYSLIHLYEGRLPLCHVDLYRIEGSEALASLGLEEVLESEGIAAIEWADKAAEVLPRDCLNVEIRILGADRRDMFITAREKEGEHQAWLDRARQRHKALEVVTAKEDEGTW